MGPRGVGGGPGQAGGLGHAEVAALRQLGAGGGFVGDGAQQAGFVGSGGPGKQAKIAGKQQKKKGPEPVGAGSGPGKGKKKASVAALGVASAAGKAGVKGKKGKKGKADTISAAEVADVAKAEKTLPKFGGVPAMMMTAFREPPPGRVEERVKHNAVTMPTQAPTEDERAILALVGLESLYANKTVETTTPPAAA